MCEMLVEPVGVEPTSENKFTEASPSAAIGLILLQAPSDDRGVWSQPLSR